MDRSTFRVAARNAAIAAVVQFRPAKPRVRIRATRSTIEELRPEIRVPVSRRDFERAARA